MAFTFNHLAEVAWGNAPGQTVGDRSLRKNQGTERSAATAGLVTGGIEAGGEHVTRKCF